MRLRYYLPRPEVVNKAAAKQPIQAPIDKPAIKFIMP
jgi:hypothetical protein